MNKTKKKLLMYSTLAMLGVSQLTACGQKKYTVGEDGTIELTGNISYNTLCSDYILELDYEDKTSVYAIEKQYSIYNNSGIHDIKTEKHLCDLDESENELIDISYTDFKISSIKDILVENEMIKDYYNSDDIDKIIELYKEKNNIDKEKILENSLED